MKQLFFVPDGVRTTIPVGEECVININTADAGFGNITCHIRSTSGSDVDIDVVENRDGTVSILYTPRVPGAHTLNIKFGGQPVPNGNIVQQVRLHMLRILSVSSLVQGFRLLLTRFEANYGVLGYYFTRFEAIYTVLGYYLRGLRLFTGFEAITRVFS